MRLGLALPHYDTSLAGRPASWDSVRTIARAAESSGFASIWMSDHLFLDWSKYGGPHDAQGTLECWTTMAALAAQTERVRIGSLTTCNDLRNPGLLAKMAATVDRLSGGRVDVGLGAGWYEPEYQAAGIDFDPAGTRIRRLGEAAQIVGRLLDGEEFDFDGDHYRMKGVVCRPGPVQSPRPPIWIGGKGDLLLRTAARVADGWNFSWAGSLDAYRERAGAAERACEAAGRDPATLRRSVGAKVLVGRDTADARRRYERLVEVTPPGVLGGVDGRPAVSWEEFQRDHFAGAAADVGERLGRFADLGVEEVVVSIGTLPFQVADEEDVGTVGEALAPALERR